MIYYELSPSQLEAKANEIIERHDKERLFKAKPIDVYDIVDLLGCTPDWFYITPDQSILGMTAFHDVAMWSWPSDHYEKGMIPERVKVDKGTIVIDRAIQESGNTGRENFTVIHECFHQVLHPKCFKNRGADYSKMCNQKSFKNDTERRKNMSAIDIIEYQANFSAAAFLMPRKAVINTFSEVLGNIVKEKDLLSINNDINRAIGSTAKLFGVNYSALKYRLQSLKVLEKQTATEEYIV